MKKQPPIDVNDVGWPIVAAGFGTLLVLSFLMPVDSISVFIGSALPQNLGWLSLAAVAAVLSRRSSIQARTGRLELLIVGGGLVWLMLVSWIVSSRGDGRAVWSSFWQIVSLASCFYIGRALVTSDRVRRALVILVVVGCTSLSILGLEQVLVSMPNNRAEYLKDPDRMLMEQGIDAPPGSAHRKQFEDRLNSPEPFATFALANSLATLLSLGVVLNGGVLFNAVGRMRTNGWGCLVAPALMLVTQLVCLLLTRSRTAYLALMFALLVWMVLEWSRGKVVLSKRTLRWGSLATGVVVLAGLGWLISVDRLVWSEAPKSISYRLEYWQATLAMIRDYAVTGVGMGNFQAFYPQYKLEQASEIIADPHNWVLDIAATLSVPTMLIAGGWLGVVLTKSLSICLRETSSELATIVEQKQEAKLVVGLVIGAIGGGVIATSFLVLIGMLDVGTLQVMAIAWSVAGALGWLAWRYGAAETSQSNLIAAMLVVLCGLLASGGWQASGIAVPLLVVVAVLAKRTEPVSDGGEHAGGVGWAGIVPGFAIAAVMIFVLQAWRPVMQSWVLAAEATGARSTNERVRLMEAAVAADPLDAEREVQLIQLLAARVNGLSSASEFSVDAKPLMERLSRLSPPNVVGYLRPKLAGQIAFDMAASAKRLELPNAEYLAAAGGFYSLAVERYPSNVELQVQRAVVAALAGDWSTAAEAVRSAEEISDRTPHLDKKLAAQQVWLPLVPEGYESQTGYVAAEPLAAWLRTQSNTRLGEPGTK